MQQVAIARGSLPLVAQNFQFSEICFQIFNFQDCEIFACADVTGHVLLNGGKNKSDLRNPKLPPALHAFQSFLGTLTNLKKVILKISTTKYFWSMLDRSQSLFYIYISFLSQTMSHCYWEYEYIFLVFKYFFLLF